MNRLTAYGLSGLWLALSFAGAQGCGNGGGGGETTTAVVTCGAGTEQDGSVCTVSLDASVLCGPGTTFSGGVCVATTTADATVPVTCGTGTMLSGNMCVPSSSGTDGGAICGAGTMLSGGVCVAIPGDAAVITCGPGTVDEGGTCVVASIEAGPDAPVCGAGTHACSGQCYANDDGTHCGATCTACASSTPACVSGACACSANSCPSGQACENGACVSAPCTAGNCNGGMCCNSACVVGATCCQASDCPAVNACQVSVACTSNQCVYENQPAGTSCGGSSYCCGGGCTNVEGDKNNCGTCGNVCYGGSPYAACINGYCAELVAQEAPTAPPNGSTSGQSSVGNPSLAIDANNVYFLNPTSGTVLQSPISNLGNTSPQVLFTNVSGTTYYDVQALVVDATRVYYMATGNGGLVGSTLIGGGSSITYPLGSYRLVNSSPTIAIDASNLYVAAYAGNYGVAYAPKSGGTIGTSLPSDYIAENIFDNGTYLFWPQCPGNGNCEITRYDVTTSSTAFLAMNQAQPSALTASATNVYWSGQSAGTPPDFIMVSPIDGSTGPTTFEGLPASEAPPTMSVDPATGTLYWILGSNGGVLQKASTAGQVPVTIMSNGQNVWGTPCFDATNVYYMMTDGANEVQVWRSPK
jgi:hypothetical protein